jgi:hypothetical protein
LSAAQLNYRLSPSGETRLIARLEKVASIRLATRSPRTFIIPHASFSSQSPRISRRHRRDLSHVTSASFALTKDQKD